MISRRHIEPAVDITSFQHNERFQGLLPSGRYRGFDTLAGFSGGLMQISHIGSGYKRVDQNQVVTNNMGLFVTPQGTIVQCEGLLEVELATNVGNNAIRYDVVIARHVSDANVPGGSDVEYVIVQTANISTFTAPIPASDTILGYFTVAANQTISLVNVTYTPALIPSLADEDYARINEVNRFLKQNQNNQGTGFTITNTSYGLVSKYTGAFNNDGNFYRLASSVSYLDLLPMLPVGTMIALNFKFAITLRDAKYLGTGADEIEDGNTSDMADFTASPIGYAQGYAGIEIATLLEANYTLVPDSIILLQMIDKGGDYGKRWKLVASSSLISQVGTLSASLNSLSNTVSSHTTSITNLSSVQSSQGVSINNLTTNLNTLGNAIDSLSTSVGQKASKTPQPAQIFGVTTGLVYTSVHWQADSASLESNSPLQFRKNDMGMVVLMGRFEGKGTNPGGVELMATLPSGYRPSPKGINTLAYNLTTLTLYSIIIEPTGYIYIVGAPTNTTDKFSLVAPITFYGS